MTIDANRLKSVLAYDPASGAFTWKVSQGKRAAGSSAGNLHRYGYTRIHIDGREYKAHRLAWLYMHGDWPVGVIDHINGDRNDNRIANLRDVDHRINSENRKGARAGKAIPLMGVKKQTLSPTFTASIKVNGKVLALGGFKTPEEAHAAYMTAKAKHHIGALAAFQDKSTA